MNFTLLCQVSTHRPSLASHFSFNSSLWFCNHKTNKGNLRPVNDNSYICTRSVEEKWLYDIFFYTYSSMFLIVSFNDYLKNNLLKSFFWDSYLFQIGVKKNNFKTLEDNCVSTAIENKVHISWEGHKNMKKSPNFFWRYE